jgi:2-polyprenyl-3-methyl-5-hydroxy-6-metoxy-1,4-benzoquinol methylase
VGIEPDSNQQLVKNAKENLDYFINDYLTKDTDLPKNYFDLILFNDVLEHMYDPWDILLFIKRAIN